MSGPGSDMFGIGAMFECLAVVIGLLLLAIAELLLGFLVSWTAAAWLAGVVGLLLVGSLVGRWARS